MAEAPAADGRYMIAVPELASHRVILCAPSGAGRTVLVVRGHCAEGVTMDPEDPAFEVVRDYLDTAHEARIASLRSDASWWLDAV